jgi:hypothetical protein
MEDGLLFDGVGSSGRYNTVDRIVERALVVDLGFAVPHPTLGYSASSLADITAYSTVAEILGKHCCL